MNRPFRQPTARRGLGRAFASLAVAGGLIVGVALPALAHIIVTVPGGTTEGLGNLTFQVHNESATAVAIKVTVHLPLDHPFGAVNPFHVAGWTITTVTSKLPKPTKSGDFNLTQAVSSVTWTAATGQGIPAGEIQLLTLNAGPYPKAGSLGFPTDVYLSDGSVVHWNQPTPANGQEPANPIPTLDLARVVANDAVVVTPTPSASASPNSTSSSSNSIAMVLSIIALLLALLAVLVAAASRRKAKP
jgi:uncharacterized protein YcnI